MSTAGPMGVHASSVTDMAAPEKVAVVLRADLPPGPAANVAACVAAGLAGALPGWAGRGLRDGAGLHSASSAHLPIAVLRADAPALSVLLQRLRQQAPQGRVCVFPAYAQSVNDCQTYWAQHAHTDHTQAELLGVGLAGTRRWVNTLAGSLGLWR